MWMRHHRKTREAHHERAVGSRIDLAYPPSQRICRLQQSQCRTSRRLVAATQQARAAIGFAVLAQDCQFRHACMRARFGQGTKKWDRAVVFYPFGDSSSRLPLCDRRASRTVSGTML